MDNNQNYTRSIGLVEADIEANCIKHGVRGILEHNDILKIISEYDDEDKQARIFGKFQHLTGLVFKNFNRSIHLLTPFDINRRDYVVINLLDPHPRNPDAVMWLAVDKYGRKIVIDEIFKNFESDGELAAAIKQKDDYYRVVKHLIDPSAFNVDQHTGRSLASDLYNMGLSYERASKERHLATRTIRSALSYQRQGDIFLKPPELFIFSSCNRTIWEIEHYQYQEWSSKTALSKSPNEKPVDKDDHEIENLGRGLLADVVFSEEVPIETNAYGTMGYQDDQPRRKNIDDPYE